MRLRGWRIVRNARATVAFDGEGARLNGGRWNPEGLPAVYLSEHASLAALEILVHTHPIVPTWGYTVLGVEFDSALMETLALQDCPREWDSSPAASSAAFGGRWIREARSAILCVPSSIVPIDRNFILNPRHPDFGQITIFPPEPFHFDPRLIGR